MEFKMWLLDIGREQAPTIDHLRTYLRLTREAGYDSIGLYLEHRFAYPSTPWAHGRGAVTPEMIETLVAEFPDIQIVPFINLLGHFEGFLYTEEGSQFAEQEFSGLQACPCNPAFVRIAERMIDDTIAIFPSELIHLGGDETWQLGKCPRCAKRVQDAEEKSPGVDGKAVLYAEHFGPLVQRVASAGRRPGLWADMFLEHPQALAIVPQDALMFDWQYFQSPEPTSRKLCDAGFEVVCCPTIQTYDAIWAHLPQSERNVQDAVIAARRIGALGVCITTWECGLFGNYETLFPAIRASAQMMSEWDSQENDGPPVLELLPATQANEIARALTDAPRFLKAYLEECETYEEWARLMGVELNQLGSDVFIFTGTRSGLKVRLLLYSNPFLAWKHHRVELSGPTGDAALDLAERALAVAPNGAARGSAQFLKSAVQFVRFAEDAHRAYAAERPGEAITHLAPCRQIFDDLSKVARATNLRIGGSLADIERCRIAKEHVERVIRRIKEFGDGSLGYLPSFLMLTHPKFVPHDQAGWWLVNQWANE